jgi:hypothetical protein
MLYVSLRAERSEAISLLWGLLRRFTPRNDRAAHRISECVLTNCSFHICGIGASARKRSARRSALLSLKRH